MAGVWFNGIMGTVNPYSVFQGWNNQGSPATGNPVHDRAMGVSGQQAPKVLRQESDNPRNTPNINGNPTYNNNINHNNNLISSDTLKQRAHSDGYGSSITGTGRENVQISSTGTIPKPLPIETVKKTDQPPKA